MNQWHMFNFSLQREYEKDGKTLVRQYIFQLEPGSSWEEIQSVLDQFKREFDDIHQMTIQAEAQAQKKSQENEPVQEAG